MTVKRLYRIKRADGGTTVSPNRPDGCGYTHLTRLIADEGKMLTRDGVALCPVVDTESTDGWYEVDAPLCEEGEAL